MLHHSESDPNAYTNEDIDYLINLIQTHERELQAQSLLHWFKKGEATLEKLGKELKLEHFTDHFAF